jgi:protein arginine kinase
MGREPAAWMSGGGPCSSIVLSSRVRLARNVQGIPFGTRASEEEKGRVVAEAQAAAREAPTLAGSMYLDVSGLAEIDRHLLVERYLISRDLAAESGSRGVIVTPDEGVSVLINEEDHLRLQGIVSGYQIETAWTAVDRLDTELGARLGYSYSESWGYLTACPTNAGTGMRASVLVHLPSLVLTKEIGRVLHGVSQVGLNVRGLHGEGSEVMGNFFQVSSQATLGLSEPDIVQNLIRVTQHLIENEGKAGEVLLRDARAEIEDKVFRAYGILLYCRVISSEEVMSLTSAVRLGHHLGLLTGVSTSTLNRMLILTQPAHVLRSMRGTASAATRDELRAEIVRGLLAPKPSAN